MMLTLHFVPCYNFAMWIISIAALQKKKTYRYEPQLFKHTVFSYYCLNTLQLTLYVWLYIIYAQCHQHQFWFFYNTRQLCEGGVVMFFDCKGSADSHTNILNEILKPHLFIAGRMNWKKYFSVYWCCRYGYIIHLIE